MTIAFPGESADYRAARDRLPEQEIELRHGPPLASRSCAPPAQQSNVITVGTPDANGRRRTRIP
jgi:hypothetical protein